MKKTKIIFTVIFTLLTGLIIGSIVTYFLTKPNIEKFNFQEFHAAKIKSIVNKLDLSKQQKEQFYAIHVKYLSHVCATLQKDKPIILKFIKDEKNEINSILTPEQQKRFEKIRTKQINKFKTRFANIKLLKKQFPTEKR